MVMVFTWEMETELVKGLREIEEETIVALVSD